MTDAAARRDTAFIGHPIGLGWLTVSEMFERFSYYGMQALLVLYMTGFLFKPEHVGHVWGFAAFRRLLDAGGHMTPLALGSAIFGLYTSVVYITPILGGLIADRLTGRTLAVTLGAILMAFGHFLMAFEQSFLIALTCLIFGTGLFKGNISSQVGDLYGPDDPRRADAFQIFLFAIQIAGIVTPLVCGTLGEVYGWHWGFGAAGIGMLVGLAAYLAGRPTFPPDPRAKSADQAHAPPPPLSAADWRRIAVLVAPRAHPRHVHGRQPAGLQRRTDLGQVRLSTRLFRPHHAGDLAALDQRRRRGPDHRSLRRFLAMVGGAMARAR